MAPPMCAVNGQCGNKNALVQKLALMSSVDVRSEVSSAAVVALFQNLMSCLCRYCILGQCLSTNRPQESFEGPQDSLKRFKIQLNKL